MKTVLPTIAAVAGLLLLVLSVMWSTLFPPQRTWTEDKSTRLSELGAETNRLKFGIVEAQQTPSGDPRKSEAYLQAQYDKVRSEYDTLQAEFETARDMPNTMSTMLRYIAIALVGLAAVMMLVNRQST